MRLTPRWTVALAGLLVTIVAGGFAAAAIRDHGRTGRAGALVAAVDRAKGVAGADSASHVAAVVATDQVRDTLHRAFVVYDTLRRHVNTPVTAADTASVLAALPGFRAAADELRARAERLDGKLLAERASSAHLDSSRVAVIQAQDKLVDALRYVPRVASAIEARYDPIAGTPGIAARVTVRVVNDWSVGVGGELWLASGERARAYVLVSHPIF